MMINNSFSRTSFLVKQAFVAIMSLLFASFAYSKPVDYAAGKPTSSSGSYSIYTPDRGNDGDIYTIWNGGTWAAWWQVDLGAVYAIDHINVFSMDGEIYHTTFQLSSSIDGLSWSPIGARTTMVGAPVLWNISFDSEDDAMRYIRYTTFAEDYSDWASLGELQAIGDEPVGIPEPAALSLVGLALAGLSTTRRRIRS